MRCENLFCIYWDNNICIIDNISLDIQGRCTDCIFVDPDPTLLKSEREKILLRFEKRYKEWEEQDKLKPPQI